MPKAKKNSASASATSATVGYEAQLWQMADALRGSMDAAEYKHVCLGLLALKYVPDEFEGNHAALLAERVEGAPLPDRAAVLAGTVPTSATWSFRVFLLVEP